MNFDNKSHFLEIYSRFQMLNCFKKSQLTTHKIYSGFKSQKDNDQTRNTIEI